MTTGYIYPNGDLTKGWTSTGTDNYTEIDEDRASPNEADYLYDEASPDIVDIYSMQTIAEATSITQIKLWVYGYSNDPGPVDCKGDISVDGGSTWVGLTAFSLDGSYGWKSVTFNGTWNQTQLAALRVKLQSLDTGSGVYVAAMYAEITYTIGTNLHININDAWKSISAAKINIGDAWKSVVKAFINIGDAWKTIF